MVDLIHDIKLDDILTGDEGKFAYLFPYRDRIPKIKKHAFSNLRHSNQTTDKYLVSTMMDTDYIGWTAKTLLNIDLFPIQMSILQILWKTTFPMLIACRGGSKTFMLAVYSILRAILDQGCKIVIVGSGLRQAKLVFSEIETIWNRSPILRSIVGGGKKAGPRQNVDLCYFRIGESIIHALPLGDGTKIRGFRATVVIVDEFASVPEDVFDIVVRGFAATAKTPVEEARKRAIDKKLKDLGVPVQITEKLSNKKVQGNQIIYSGTAYYEFNHFAKKFKMWKEIIHSEGKPEEVARIFGGPNMVPENFDTRDYAVIRVPHNYLPDGLLDTKQLAHAKALLPKNIYMMEYGAVFVKDSDGFFPRSLIEKCTCYPGKPIYTSDGEIEFTAMMEGAKNRKYVMGIDPAAERDNLAISIIEVWQNHYRVVYCWSVNKGTFEKRKKQGLVNDGQDYYEYCCNKIREIYRLFKPERIEMDSQGGGYPISEMLRNKKLVNRDIGDVPIYEIIDPDEPKEIDGESDGPHILHLVKQSTEFNAQANICLHKSFETKRLLFPAFNTVKMQAALIAEIAANISFDTFDENVDNIEEMKNELCTIHMSETSTGKERFDTPTIIQPGSVEGRQRKGRLRKDRYTSLLLAHKYIYDNEVSFETSIDYEDISGNFKIVKGVNPNQKMYKGPGAASFTNKGPGQNSYGATQSGEVFEFGV